MPRPEDVNPSNFRVHYVLYNDDEFSVAWGMWEDGLLRLAMRWNGLDNDPGYPKLFKHPVWFLVSDSLIIPVLRGLVGVKHTDSIAIANVIGKLVGNVYPDISISMIQESKKFDGDINLIKVLKETIEIKLGIRSLPIINVGCINCDIYEIKSGVAIPIAVNSKDQIIFEKDLHSLIDFLKCLKGPITLIFAANGTLVLPDWFFSICRQLGILIIVLESESQIHDLVSDLL